MKIKNSKRNLIKTLFWDEQNGKFRTIWEYTISIVIDIVAFIILVSLFADHRSAEDKLRDYDNAYNQCIEHGLDDGLCQFFAISESGLLNNP